MNHPRSHTPHCRKISTFARRWFCGGAALLTASSSLLAASPDPYFPAGPLGVGVRAIRQTADGGLLVGGTMTTLTENAVPQTVARLVKYDSSGHAVPYWGAANSGANDTVRALAPTVEGGTWVGGDFTMLGSNGFSGVSLLLANGTLDATFPANSNLPISNVVAISPLADGSAFVASSGLILKLRRDGMADPTFSAAVAFNYGSIQAIVPTESGRIYVLGSFIAMNGAGSNQRAIVRLMPDGSLDSSFTSPFGSQDFETWNVGYGTLLCGAETEEGKLLVGGAFSSVGGVSRKLVARLNPDGSLDTTFNAGLALSETLADAPKVFGLVRSIAVLNDSTVAVGGRFVPQTPEESDVRRNLALLNSNGNLLPDTLVNYPLDGEVHTLLATRDVESPALYVGGDFTNAGQPGYAAEMAGSGQSGAYLQGSLLRVTGLSPALVTSSPAITRQPWASFFRQNVGDPQTLSVDVSGVPAPVVRWYRSGNPVPLAIGTNLDFAALTVGDSGTYHVVATNSVGSVTSESVTLTVATPTTAPTLTAWNAPVGIVGTSYSFQFTADGSPTPTFSLQSGTLPDGLTLNASGLLSGTPTTSFSGNLTIVATNSKGSDSKSFHLATAPAAAPAFTVQPQIITRTELDPFQLSVTVTGWPTPTLQWFYEDVAIPGATDSTYSQAHTDWNNAGRYHVVATNVISSTQSADGSVNITELLTRPGKKVSSYNANSIQLTTNSVLALAPLADGSVFVAGSFEGTANKTRLNRVARVTSSGGLASGFSPGTGPDGDVLDACTDTMNRVVLAGAFRNYSGQAVPGIVRVLADGKPDSSFAIALSKDWFEGYNSTPTGLVVGGIAPAPDGGVFACVVLEVSGLWRSGVVRFRPDGSVHTPIHPDHTLRTAGRIAATRDGSIITAFGERLNADLTLHTAYNANADAVLRPVDAWGQSLPQFDASVVVVDSAGNATFGAFSENGFGRVIVRLLPDGTADTAYAARINANQLTGSVDSMLQLPGGRLFVGGTLGSTGKHLVVLNASGDPEPTWYPFADLTNNNLEITPHAYAATLTASGNLIIGGKFDRINGEGQLNTGMLYAWQRAAQTLSFTQELPDRTSTSLPVTLTATANSGLPVRYRVTGPATLAGDSGTLLLTGDGGTVTITASQPGDAEFLAAPEVTRSFTVTSSTINQTISFTVPGEVPVFGDAPVALTATSTSGLPVTLEVVSGPGSLGTDNRTLTLTGAGEILLRATQPGNTTYRAATAVEQTLFVEKAQATITLSGLSATYSGSQKTVTATTSPAGLTVTVLYNYSVMQPTEVGSYPIIANINDDNYWGTASGTLVISERIILPPTIPGGAPSATITRGTGGISIQLPSLVGYSYQLQASATLNAESWANVGEPLPGTGKNLVFPAIETSTEQPTRFFRVAYAPTSAP